MAVKLSSRLQRICDVVPDGARLVDVGCDHALVEIYLLQTGKIKQALAMDVADGPLAIARQNLELTGFSERCEVRKSDGLKAYRTGEADTLVIAGMGGILMQRILEEGAGEEGHPVERYHPVEPTREKTRRAEKNAENRKELSGLKWAGEDSGGKQESTEYPASSKTAPSASGKVSETQATPEIASFDTDKISSLQYLILSPQSEPWLVRQWLRQHDIGITREDLVEEDGKFYPILFCEPGKPGLYPDWDYIAEKAEDMPDPALTAAGLTPQIRASLATMLRAPAFRQQAEDDYGPCLIRDRNPVLRQFTVTHLRRQLQVATTLETSATTSANARQRLVTVQTEIGILQTLLYVLTFG